MYQGLKKIHDMWKEESLVTARLIKKEKDKIIKQCIENRFCHLQDNPKKMINNLLNKQPRRIVTDHLIEKLDNNEINIIMNPESIKTKVRTHYENWTRPRSIQDISNLPHWREQYEPKQSINPEWYSLITVSIGIEEIRSTIRKKNNNSAPGPSTIPYILLKNLGTKGLTILQNLFNKVLSTGIIPSDWKKGNIFPIPKTKEWMGDINITRPITLLETTRKIFMSILNNRLAEVFINHNILSNNNWVGLPGGSTQQPIHILNNIMEDAHENNQEAWIFSQDISKAFDSINKNMLIKALVRIKIPTIIIDIITNTLSNRENKVIILHSMTDPYQVHDGIDQGDTISPLL
jgi:hypothetical protein